ncbi:MAG: Amidohydrolase [Candidatus Izimaplasma bacterium HR2]|nr:MAG: Amidohydrolase [Candidatus Izimaplasma bacterium HR2]
MGLTETDDIFSSKDTRNPMKLDLDVNPDNLYVCLGFNPLEDYNIETFEQHITKNTVGIKIYAGYYYYHVYDKIYKPLYELARKHNLPVVIHSGDTFSTKGLLKYAHPLEVDKLAFQYPDVKFIIAHFGDPWIMDTVVVASKNKNVYIDLSGLIMGNKKEVERFSIDAFTSRIREGLVYLDNYDKVLFGTDWPLVDFNGYVDFIKELIPSQHHEKVLYFNAKSLFRI